MEPVVGYRHRLHFSDVRTMIRGAMLEGSSLANAVQRVTANILANYSLSEIERFERELKGGNFTGSSLDSQDVLINSESYQLCVRLVGAKITGIERKQTESEKIEGLKGPKQKSLTFFEYVILLKREMEKTQSFREAMRRVGRMLNALPLEALLELENQAEEYTVKTIVPDQLLYADGFKKRKTQGESYESLTTKCLESIILRKRQAKIQECLETGDVQSALEAASQMERRHKFTNESYLEIVNHLRSKCRFEEALSIAYQYLDEGEQSREVISELSAKVRSSPRQLAPPAPPACSWTKLLPCPFI